MGRIEALVIIAGIAGFVLGFGAGFETARECVRKCIKRGSIIISYGQH